MGLTLIYGVSAAAEKKYAVSLFGGTFKPTGDLKDWDGSGVFGISILRKITDSYGIMIDASGYSVEYDSSSYYGKIDTTALEALFTVTFGSSVYVYAAGGVGYYVNSLDEEVKFLSISNSSTGSALGYVAKFGVRSDSKGGFFGLFVKYNTNDQEVYDYINGRYYKANFGGTSYGLELGIHF